LYFSKGKKKTKLEKNADSNANACVVLLAFQLFFFLYVVKTQKKEIIQKQSTLSRV